MDLTPDQEAEARRIFEVLKDKADAELWAVARLLAAKEMGELFGRTEFEVRDQVHRIGAGAVESALAGRKKGGYLGSSIACGQCDRSARFQRYQARRVVTALGCVRYERAYYYCRHCGAGASPADTLLHVAGADLTPAARELVALAGTLSSFAEAAEKVLPRLAGLRVRSRRPSGRPRRPARSWAGGWPAGRCSGTTSRGGSRRTPAGGPSGT